MAMYREVPLGEAKWRKKKRRERAVRASPLEPFWRLAIMLTRVVGR